MNVFDHHLVAKLVDLALEEDFGTGDVTSALICTTPSTSSGYFIAKEPLVMAGAPLVGVVYARMGVEASIDILSDEGAFINAGERLLKITGETQALLTAERVCLNFLQRCSGIATLTRRFVNQAKNGCVILDTRKTVPGWRLLDKYAVRTGGGRNHRMSLADGIMIKDNHIIAANGLRNALARVQEHSPHLLRCEVEVDSLEELRVALEAGVDVVLLDNMNSEMVQQALALIDGRCRVELSGGVTLDTVARLSALGPDMISVGALTHQARAVDISFDLEPAGVLV